MTAVTVLLLALALQAPPTAAGASRTVAAAQQIYDAVTSLTYHPRPQLPASGPGSSSWSVNTLYVDPTFGTRIVRVTDPSTLVGTEARLLNKSFFTPSSAEQNAWNADSTKFYVGMNGWVIPFAFDPATLKATRIPDSDKRYGGLVLTGLGAGGEPAFSFTNPDWIYGAAGVNGAVAFVRYDFSTRSYTTLKSIDADTCSAARRIGSFSVSANEVLAIECGGAAQDDSRAVAVYDARGGSLRILDTLASTIDGQPLPDDMVLGWKVHNARIDKSGHFVVLTTVGGKPYPLAVWDIQRGTVHSIELRGNGHKVSGYGSLINADALPGDYGPQFLMRPLAAEGRGNPRNLLPVHPPPYFHVDMHLSWNNCQAGASVPIVVSSYPAGAGMEAALADEIFGVSTDGSGRIWRFAHHRSIIDSNFWSRPRGNVSQDGRFFLFNSNWEHTLGSSDGKDFRVDAFVAGLNRVRAGPPAMASVLNAASLEPDVAPGSRVSIFGVQFAPGIAVGTEDPLPVELAGVSVTVNGVPAPMLSVDSGQIDAQLPFEIPPGPAEAVIAAGGMASDPLPFIVSEAAPGLFLAGPGRVLAFNQDLTVNATANQARAGSLITVYVTGQGAVDPPIATGSWALADPLNRPVLPLSATLGGRDAPIAFAALSPATVGVLQVSLVVPDLPPGEQPLIINVGSARSNSAVVSVY